MLIGIYPYGLRVSCGHLYRGKKGLDFGILNISALSWENGKNITNKESLYIISMICGFLEDFLKPTFRDVLLSF